MKKLERQDKRKGRGPDPDLEWLIANQADALQVLAGKHTSSPQRKKSYVYFQQMK